MSKETEDLKATLETALKNLEGYTLIKTDWLADLVDDSDLLDCLKAVGVENWSGYDQAKEMFYDEE